MPPTGAAYNIDWIWSFDSNTHIATHADWFTKSSFRPIESQITVLHPQHPPNNNPSHPEPTHPVLGIGDVTLQVRRLIGPAAKNPNLKAGAKNSDITLRNVLYVPSCPCNVMGDPVREDYDVSIGAERWLCSKKSGVGVGMLDRNKLGLTKILLKGQAKGESGLEGGDGLGEWKVGVKWEEAEREKWFEERKSKEKT